MPTLVETTSWKWLSEHAKDSDAELLLSMKPFLLKQFKQAFELLRTQKLLSRSRSYDRVKSLCNDLESWAKTATIGREEKKLLIGHCRITLGFQAMMTEMRERAKALDIWALSYFDFSTILISTLDAIDLAYEAGLALSAERSGGGGILGENWDKNWLYRGLFDSGLLILQEARKACSQTSNFAVGNPVSFTEALDIAKQTSEVMQGWDHYSLGGHNISVKKNVIDASTMTAWIGNHMLILVVGHVSLYSWLHGQRETA